MALRSLINLLEWLAVRAGANLGTASEAGSWGGPGTADRAGQLVPAPQDGLEPEVGRSFGHWALWAAVGVVLVILATGYVRRRWRSKGATISAWLTWRGPR